MRKRRGKSGDGVTTTMVQEEVRGGGIGGGIGMISL